MPDANPRRPYLVIPKLVEQPTWGGQHIVEAKGWSHIEPLSTRKIGQSYELFSGSNLSLLESTADPAFAGELTDRDAVASSTHPAHSLALSAVIDQSPNLLIKYTQALGNSFQAHIKDGVTHPKWLPKPESWYYFEPGLITLGVKPGIDWDHYRAACKAVEQGMTALGADLHSGALNSAGAHPKIKALLEKYDPWQYVNTVPVAKNQLVDLSHGGLHHSWEEDARQAPHGNVLYELQAEALDAVSTFRSFDKGKMEPDGSVRSLQIDQYFEFIDRDPVANDPTTHIRQAQPVRHDDHYALERLMTSPHYSLDKLTLKTASARFHDTVSHFVHLFVQSGQIRVATSEGSVTVGTAHSCFIPAAAAKFEVTSLSAASEVLISY